MGQEDADMQHSEFLSHVISTLKRYEMLPEHTAVLVGFSGGADSVTLLSVLHRNPDEYVH